MTARAPRGREAMLWLAAPFVVAAVLLVGLPALLALGLAFTDYDALSAPRFVGVAHFLRLWDDPLFWTALGNSLLFAALAVPLRLVAAMGLALLLHKRAGVARSAVFLPTVVPDLAYALLWLWLLNPLYGPLALVLKTTGLADGGWLLTPWGARGALVALTVFQLGEVFVVLLAARRELPQELYELCELEGGGALTVFRKVTLPLMAPTLGLLAARDVMKSLQTTFVPALVITQGGPRYATTFLPLYIYQNGFEYLRIGYASAMTWVMFLVTVAMVAAQLWVLRGWRTSREA
ncbi:carbohydrate ABC transporter permease [Pyxidicoccus xibeiensis]|uniref:carbohydrate ABC transporter permease n=1 Tax=Pyxidicoccus xibeiensis TaxID=2906759 RepID=UPI0020A77296|nr:ABC transporter permease subunit [Pyxidicoccus xibeiensis]MCP3141635.1 sugar ABC transporter permease [Pyxidicoccus xibeiensis]